MSILGGYTPSGIIRSLASHQTAFTYARAHTPQSAEWLAVGAAKTLFARMFSLNQLKKEEEEDSDELTLRHQLFDLVSSLLVDVVQPATEQCNSAHCRRLTVCYNALYSHSALLPATHSALHEILGLPTLRVLQQMLKFAQKGFIVNANGEDVYLQQGDTSSAAGLNLRTRVTFPVLLLVNRENGFLLPEWCRASFDTLKNADLRVTAAVARVRRTTRGHAARKGGRADGVSDLSCIL